MKKDLVFLTTRLPAKMVEDVKNLAVENDTTVQAIVRSAITRYLNLRRYNSQYYDENKAILKKRSRQHYADNREQLLEDKRKYEEENRDKINARRRKRRREIRDLTKGP